MSENPKYNKKTCKIVKDDIDAASFAFLIIEFNVIRF